jgi:Asp-tRNA(Asn)/Glu-tRNA(Gln) amidotransferase B subunit
MATIKVKALINCSGIDYDLEAGETAELKSDLAKTLIDFNYVEEVEVDEIVEEVEVEKIVKEVEVEKIVEEVKDKKPKETRAKK